MKVKVFVVPVSWRMYGEVKVKAKDADEAVMKAMEAPLPKKGATYMDDSFQVQYEEVKEVEE